MAKAMTKDEKRTKTADRMEPIDHQMRHRDIAEGETIRAGETIRVVQPPLDRYQKRKIITPRQHRAGAKLADDYQLGILGARDPEAKGSSGVKVGLSEAQILAAEAYRKAVQAMGKRLSSIVIAVCCEEKDISVIATRRDLDPKQLMGALKIGLDHLGDHYGEAPEVVEEIIKVEDITVLERGKPVPALKKTMLTYRHEADGTVRSVQLGAQLWDCIKPSVGELRAAARKLLDGE
jgi:hypothetical protein